MRARHPSVGFTLIELGIAIFILALILSAAIVPLQGRVSQRQFNDARGDLSEIREALLGYAVANVYLPCPDKTTAAGAGTANDGVEDVSGGACVSLNGNIPWVTLGIRHSDPWGNRYRYRVVAAYAARPSVMAFSTPADLQVCSSSACTDTLTDPLTAANRAAAVVMSHGPNGYGAINTLTGTANTAPTSADELVNLGTTTNFVSRPVALAGAAGGEFDDVVAWLARPTLFNRMVSAGKLP